MESSTDRPVPERRRFLLWMSRGLLWLWVLGFGWVIAAFLKPPRSRRSLADRLLRVGPVDSLQVGKALMVRRGREPIFVIRTDEERFVALSGACTHYHCVLLWDEERAALACPCHRGAFDVNGNVLEGPPPRPLDRFRVETRLGEIYVHL